MSGLPAWIRLALAGLVAWLLASGLCQAAPAAPAVPPLVDQGDEAGLLEFEARFRPMAVADDIEQRLARTDVPVRRRYLLLRQLGLVRIGLAQRDAAEAALQQIEQLAPQADPALRREMGVACNCLRATLHVHLGPLARADELISERELGEGLPVWLGLSCRITQALVREHQGRLDQAVRIWQDALRLADDHGPGWQRSALRNSLAYTLHHAGETERAFKLMEESKQIALPQQDWLSLSEALSVEGILLTDTGRGEAELMALTAAVRYARQAGAQHKVALGLGNLSDYYLRSGDYPQALRLTQEALPLAQASRYGSAEQLAIGNMGLALIALHRKQEGVEMLRKSMARLNQTNEWIAQVDTLKDMGRFLEQAGYYADALEAYRELRQVSQDAFQRGQQMALAELQESFEAERRQHEKALLQDDNLLKAEALRQSDLRFRQWALAAGAAAMALVLLLLGQWRLRRVRAALQRSNERLLVQSEQDPLTGLANRRHFQRVTAEAALDGEEVRGQLYLLDLDHFKEINDRHGHAAGDAVLIEVARRLQTVVREDDLVVRWGGEEFLILVPPASAGTIDTLARRILSALASTPVVVQGGHRINLSGSIGFAGFPLQPGWLKMNWAQALDLVDSAMYVAKTQGRNRAVGVRDWPGADPQEAARLMQDLEASWRDGRIHLVEIQGPVVAERDSA